MTATERKVHRLRTKLADKAKREPKFRYERLTKHLRHRSQRPYRPPEGTSFYAHCKELGLIYL